MDVYENEVTKYDPYTREFGLLEDYINTFLKLKVEASACPAGLEIPKMRNGMLRLSMLEKSCCSIEMQEDLMPLYGDWQNCV
jgi:hypothetical protein